MKIIVKGSFGRDVDKARKKEIRLSLNEKITQIENAKNSSYITGISLLDGYTNHYRIYVKSQNYSYRIGAIIKGDTIWFVRFLPRKIIYKLFP